MAFTEIDEKLLVRAYQAGDERAFDTIVRTQYQALYAHALRRLTNHESAEDAVQDTLLRAYRALPNLDGDLALRAWLHRILTNVCHDEGNRRRRQAGLLEKQLAQPEEVVDDIAEEAILFETVQTMAKALENIPESYREALVLRYVDGLSFREVAEATGTSEENARARVHRGRQALHKLLSRVAVLAAFIIPGLKRTQVAPPAGAESAAANPALSEQGVHLVTQLTTHAVQAAPAVSRLAEFSSAFPGGKSGLVGTAVAAVAAVAVPVAATSVRHNPPERPPTQVAAPADTFTSDTAPPTTASTVVVVPEGSTTTTSTTLPRSLAEPFAPVAGVLDEVVKPPTTTTTPPTTAPPPTTSTTIPPDAELIEGVLGSTSLTVVQAGTQYDIAGRARLGGPDGTAAGDLRGRIHIFDDGTAQADDLVLSAPGGTFGLRFKGTASVTYDQSTGPVWVIVGRYALTGGDELGVEPGGDVTVNFRPGGGAPNFQANIRGTRA